MLTIIVLAVYNHIRDTFSVTTTCNHHMCVGLYLPIEVEFALMLPGEAMQPEHVVELLPRQSEVGVIGVCV